LQAYDTAFKELGVQVYIILDELDKIITSNLDENKKKRFFEDLRVITDNCSRSISLIIAGTSDCKKTMDDLGFDYSPRFEVVDTNLFNEDQTIEFIKKKCRTVVSKCGQIPFSKSGMRSVHSSTGGNIRFIEAISRDIWNAACQKREKIDGAGVNSEISEKLAESVKRVLGSDTRMPVIDFISTLAMAGGKQGIAKSLSRFKPRQIDCIRQFIENNPNRVILVKGSSYRLVPEVRQNILKAYLGMAGSYGSS